MSEFKTSACRVCGKTEILRPGMDGTVLFLPRDWILYEDKTPERRGPMAHVCSDACIRKLKELNRASNNKRTGW